MRYRRNTRLLSGICFYFSGVWAPSILPESPKSRYFFARVTQQPRIAMMSQARNMKEGCPHITVATPSDEMAIKYRKWYSKAFGGGGF